ncbi:hypothetical protein EV659_11813 [Rhodothalassium salexigens DSM 2132]|uniref:Tellurite resistance protein TerB n=1 Tax=Rhodothalassium salexigens DSM 2132 TaxID=1188247 RepID=A0A4R2P4M4_RHOSA|nr:hypothetical protein [Rhodothalassium salexigens]MBB4212794.1 hypothetical protein [Rhodothalassium salexigens DSM 2132]TCP29703.1 hypothetical protein EV659_11813 [Rhodothalassium salexigens DSM 2132]
MSVKEKENKFLKYLKDWFGDLDFSPPKWHKEEKESVPDEGDPVFESSVPNEGVVDEFLDGISVGICYTDAKGNGTERWVNMQTLRTNGVIYAYCHARKQMRSFRIENIKFVYDDAGEIIDTKDFFLELGIDVSRYAQVGQSRREKKQSAFAYKEAGQEHGKKHKEIAASGMRILAALARADGDHDPVETEIILEYAIEYAKSFHGVSATDEDKKVIYKHIRYLRPRPSTVMDCVDEIYEKPMSERKLLLLYAKRLVESDGKITSEEADLLIMLNSELSIL